MPKDYANIYSLPEAEKQAELKDLWGNCVPSSKEQATLLERKLLSIEPPYVLSLEAEYGMGKTYFATRLCEQLKKDGIDCIYISAWEQDYQPSPFCFIVKEVLDYLAKRTNPVTKSKMDDLLKKGVEAVGKFLSATHFQLSVQTGFFTARADINSEKLYQSFITPKDEIKEFKKELEEILQQDKINPLVLIIDELDRCRPDYALKTLEIIKHFFDINNLVVILPVNKDALKQAVKSTYGNIEENNENYLRKLITEEITLKSPTIESYKKIVNSHISEKKLKDIIKRKNIEKNSTYNGFNLISECIGKYALAGKLTYRETVKVCSEFTDIINQIKDKIHIEYLAYKLCQKHSQMTISLNANHPFFKKINSFTEGKEKRYRVLSIDGWSAHAHGISPYVNHSQWIKNYTEEMRAWERNDHFETYKELYEFINQVKSLKDDLLKRNLNYEIKERLDWIFNAVEKKEEEAKEYQIQYGSDDTDEKKQTYYDKIVDNPLSIYEK